jgi:hypothetical protein
MIFLSRRPRSELTKWCEANIGRDESWYIKRHAKDDDGTIIWLVRIGSAHAESFAAAFGDAFRW